MVKPKKTGVVPKVRFPEFREAGEWSLTELRRVSSFVTERVGKTECVPYTVTSGEGLISQQEKLGRTIAGDSIKNYIIVRSNDFAYNKSATKAYPQGFIARYFGNERAAVPNSIFTCFRMDRDDVWPEYLNHLFSSNWHGKWLRKRISVGARAHGSLNVSDDDLMDLPLPLPNGLGKIDEQQKIADCLTSLDELITAQGRKVEALNTYKRGLMQQIFPREGETMPRLRFPEFRDAPNWTRKPLSVVAENLDNMRIPVAGVERTKGAIPYYGASGIVDYVEGYIFDEDLLCVSEDGANLVARTYPIAFPISGKTWVNNHAHVLRFSDCSTQKVVEAYLNAIDLQDFLTGMAQPKLNRSMLDIIPIPLPESDERKVIARFLSSLAVNLGGELDTLEALKVHKQALMHQLFPTVEDVE